MRVLLLHPEDSPRRGPWSGQRWDLIVDLGRSSEFSSLAWAGQMGCPIVRSDSFRNGVEDLKLVRTTLSAGQGRLLDEEGIDWWNLTSLLIAPRVETMLILERVAAEVGANAELWATRADWTIEALALLLKREIQSFSGGVLGRAAQRVAHYRGLWRRLTLSQVKEIAFDKYDPGYLWRSRFARDSQCGSGPVILVPSAYGNASRMAASYADLLPDQQFLLVATRQSGKQFKELPNMRLRDLASYATNDSTHAERAAMLNQWGRLRPDLCAIQEFDTLFRTGFLDAVPGWIRSGLHVRNFWREVLRREPVCSVLCGDDSNLYTRLPVLLAARRKIPTVDFHHGALDGRYLLKELPSDLYLAKNAMERDYLLRVCGVPSQRVMIGAPARQHALSENRGSSQRSAVVFFSEPYENAGMRAQEVYREILPPLCRLAHENARSVVLKLHAFESISDRKHITKSLLPDEIFRHIAILDGPLSERLLSSAWFGLTIESTTVLDCLIHRVPCFLAQWLTLSSYEYAQQYARFGVGDVLRSASEIAQIPERLPNYFRQETAHDSLWKMTDPEILRQWLVSGPQIPTLARQVS
jgi:hypothetical protein